MTMVPGAEYCCQDAQVYRSEVDESTGIILMRCDAHREQPTPADLSMARDPKRLTNAF